MVEVLLPQGVKLGNFSFKKQFLVKLILKGTNKKVIVFSIFYIYLLKGDALVYKCYNKI